MPDVAGEWHVASLVVRHRPEAVAALAAAIDASEGLELAMQDATRSVLVQECSGTGALMASVDRLQILPGVLSVNLVYHHVEPHGWPDPVPDPDLQEPTG
jgi:periplasmic nitrate reductase NapD